MSKNSGNLNTSVVVTDPVFKYFPFLTNRYSKGFFKNFVNEYFLFVLESAKRTKSDPNNMFEKLLSKVYDTPTDLNLFSLSYLITVIYGQERIKESLELEMMSDMDKFILSFIYMHLSELSMDYQNLTREVMRLAGLLIVSKRPTIRQKRQPRLFETPNGTVEFCEKDKVENWLAVYEDQLQTSLRVADAQKQFGRTYGSVTNEYLKFLDDFIKHYKNYANQELQEVFIRWYRRYAKGKDVLPPTPPSQTDQMDIFTLNPVHLRGRPSGSKGKK